MKYFFHFSHSVGENSLCVMEQMFFSYVVFRRILLSYCIQTDVYLCISILLQCCCYSVTKFSRLYFVFMCWCYFQSLLNFTCVLVCDVSLPYGHIIKTTYHKFGGLFFRELTCIIQKLIPAARDSLKIVFSYMKWYIKYLR